MSPSDRLKSGGPKRYITRVIKAYTNYCLEVDP